MLSITLTINISQYQQIYGTKINAYKETWNLLSKHISSFDFGVFSWSKCWKISTEKINGKNLHAHWKLDESLL